MTSYSGVPSDTKPYFQLTRSNGPGVPGDPIGIYPKLVAKPRKMKLNKDQTVMALLADLRRETIDGIGSDSEETVGGIRVFNHIDRFLFLGGAAGETAQLYEKAGPIFQEADSLPIPAGDPALFAAFSQGGRWLFVVWSSAPNDVAVFRWNRASATDPNGVWEARPALPAGDAVTDLTISPLNRFLVISTLNSSVVYRLSDGEGGSALDVVAGNPPHALLDVSADETQWLVRGNSNAEIHLFDGSAWTLKTALPATGIVASSRGKFAPNGKEILFARSNVSGSPMTFLQGSDGNWTQTYVEAHASASAVKGLVFRKDGLTAAVTLTNALEIYKRDVFVPDPIAEKAITGITGSSRGQAAAAFLGSAMIIGNGSNNAMVYVDGNGDLTQQGSTIAPGGGSVQDVALTADGTVAFAARGDNLMQIVKPATNASRGFTINIGTLGGISVSPDNQHMSILTQNGAAYNLRIFKFRATPTAPAEWTFEQVATIAVTNVNAFRTQRGLFSPQGDMVILRGNGAQRERVFKFNGSSLVDLGTLTLPASRGNQFFGPVWMPAGDRVVMGYRRTVAPQGYVFGIFRRDGDAFVFEQELEGPGGAILDLAVAPDGNGILGVSNSLAKAYVRAGANWQETPFPAGVPATPISIAWTSTMIVITSANTATKAYQWLGVNPVVAYKLAFTQAVAGVANMWAFNPDAALIHFGNGTVGYHLRLSDYAPVAALSFGSGRPPTDIYNVLFSPTGKSVIFDTPDGLELATKPGAGGDFLNAKDISGTFITIYDLATNGESFRERSYAVHISGANVIDMSFSNSGQIFSYHVYLPVNAPADAVRGRLIYDAAKAPGADHFELRGVVFDPEQTKTFIAYSPYETHAVITNERLETGEHDVQLYEFGDNYVPELRDTKPVLFGPPAFSYCDDVVVAHGGEIPFSFFKHDRVAEVLNPTPESMANWTYTGVIVDVEFRGDCSGMVIITPGMIIPIERDEDDGGEVGEEIPIDIIIPDDEDDDTDIEIDDDVITIIPPMPGPNYPGDYEGGNGGPVNNISYVPYSAVSISFRVMPVPK